MKRSTREMFPAWFAYTNSGTIKFGKVCAGWGVGCENMVSQNSALHTFLSVKQHGILNKACAVLWPPLPQQKTSNKKRS
jgi:hypothetical protein